MSDLSDDDEAVAVLPSEEWSEERIDCAMAGSPFAVEPWIEALLPWRTIGFPDVRLLERHLCECTRPFLFVTLFGLVFFSLAYMPGGSFGCIPSCLPLVALQCLSFGGLALVSFPLLLCVERRVGSRPSFARIAGAAMLTLGGYALLLAMLAPLMWMWPGNPIEAPLQILAFGWVALDVIPRVRSCCRLSRFGLTLWLAVVMGTGVRLVAMGAPQAASCWDCFLRKVMS